MKKVVLVLLFSMTFIWEFGYQTRNLELVPIKTDWDYFLEALIQVESRGDDKAVGRTHDVGILQITPIYVADVNRILGEDVYSLESRTDIKKSLEMFKIYQEHYNPRFIITKAIKLHNPRAGSWYRKKILAKMKELKNNNN